MKHSPRLTMNSIFPAICTWLPLSRRSCGGNRKGTLYRPHFLALFGLAILIPLRGSAQTDRFWQGPDDGLWDVTANWSPSGFPNAAGDGALNLQSSDSSTTQNTVGGITVGTIGHDAMGSNTNWEITTSTAITLDNSSAGALIRNTDSSTGLSNYLLIKGGGGLILADNLTISNTGGSTASAGSIRIQTPISGTGDITISNVSNSFADGRGAVAFQGANTFSGTTTIAKGETTFNNSGTFSSGQINLGESGLGDVSLVSTTSGVNASNNVVVATGTNGTSLLGSSTSGTATYSGLITLNGNVTLTNLKSGGGGITEYSNTISGHGGVKVIGPGTALLSHANTFDGSATIDSGTLNAGATGALGGTSSVTVNSTGTLLLSGSSTNRINDAATMTINGGGTFNTGGLNEGPVAGASGSSAAMGALTLANNSTIDFTSANSSNLLFSSLTYTPGNAVTIAHWTGSLLIDSGAATNDRLLFISDTGLSDAQLATFQFTDDAGNLLGMGATEIMFNGYFELVPVPEPSTWAAGVLALLALCYTQRRRFTNVSARRNSSSPSDPLASDPPKDGFALANL